MKKYFYLFLAMFLAAMPLTIHAEAPAEVTLEIPTVVKPGGQAIFVVKIDHGFGYHTYAPTEDAATTIQWRLPEGWEVGPVTWPEPISFDYQGIKSKGFTGLVTLRIPVRVPYSVQLDQKYTVGAKIDWVACGKDQCVPGSRIFIDQVETNRLVLTNPYKEAIWKNVGIAQGNSWGLDKEIQEWEQKFEAMKKPQANYGKILWAAFLGGLILNLMPCVFPVLGIKIMGFLKSDGVLNKKRAIRLSLVYTLGVVASLCVFGALALGLREAGTAVGWGFQLQDPLFVWGMMLVMGLVAMNLFGALELPVLAGNASGKLSGVKGYLGAFLTGILMVLVATPCSAPFLGIALSSVLVLPADAVMGVMIAMGLGLALPYCIFTLWPSGLKWLPKPGEWMETLKKILGFLMLASAVYLGWVYMGQISPEGALHGLLGAVIVLLGVFLIARWWGRKSLWAGVAFVVIGLWLTLAAPSQGAHGMDDAWSPEKVARFQKEGRTVVVDFTARWCVTCLVNERLWSAPQIQKLLKEKNVVFLKADWTNRNDQIASELAKHGRNAVPLVLVYTPDAHRPIELANLLTKEQIIKALR